MDETTAETAARLRRVVMRLNRKLRMSSLGGVSPAQASMLAYLDTIWIFAIAAALMAPLAFLMRRPKPGAGPAALH